MSNTLYENNTGTDDDILRISSTVFVSQNFIPQTTHYITGVELMLDLNGTGPGDGTTLTVQIKATDINHKPTGSALATGTIPIGNVSATAGYYSFALYSGDQENPFPQLVEDTEYAIVLSADSTYDADNCIVWRMDAGGGGYAYGTAFLTINGGSTWADQTPSIMMFRDYGSTDLNDILLERFDQVYDTYGEFEGVDWRGMTFTPTIRHNLKSISFIVGYGSQIGNFTVSIYATSSHLPTGSPIVTKSVAMSTMPSIIPATWFQVTFDTNPTMSVGVEYAIVFDARDDVNSQYKENGGGGYSGGVKIQSSNSGSTWSVDSGSDIMFREYGDITTYYTLVSSVGEFILTGIDIGLLKAKWYAMVASVGEFILTGINNILTFKQYWTSQTKNDTNYTEQSKNTSSYTEETKHSTSWTFKDES